MARYIPSDRDRCTALKKEERTRCKNYRMEGFGTCRKHTEGNWKGRCTAKAATTQVRCRNNAVKGYTVCNTHGAGSPYKGRPGGAAGHKRPRGPRLQKALPPELGRRYDESFNDPTLLSLRSDIALTDIRIFSLVDELPDTGSDKQWSGLRKTARLLELALANDNTTKMHKYSRQLIVQITEGTDTRGTYKDIRVEQEHKRKLSDSEWGRLKDMKQMITVEESNALLLGVVTGFNKVVTLFQEILGIERTQQMQMLFGKEMRGLQTVSTEQNKPTKKYGRKATYLNAEVLEPPKTVLQARRDRENAAKRQEREQRDGHTE